MSVKNRCLRILNEAAILARENKAFFLAPLVNSVLFFIALFVKIGPGVIMTFTYAGLKVNEVNL